jgi:hypothetical protein
MIVGLIFSKGKCQSCARKGYAPIAKSTKPINQVSPKRQASIDAGIIPKYPERKAIKKVSDKRKIENAEYKELRDAYMKANPICEYPDCTHKSKDLHHAAGRVGNFLTDTLFFKALCRPHHIWVEEHPIEAKMLGLSFSRLIKTTT